MDVDEGAAASSKDDMSKYDLEHYDEDDTQTEGESIMPILNFVLADIHCSHRSIFKYKRPTILQG